MFMRTKTHRQEVKQLEERVAAEQKTLDALRKELRFLLAVQAGEKVLRDSLRRKNTQLQKIIDEVRMNTAIAAEESRLALIHLAKK